MTDITQPAPFFDGILADAGKERFDTLYERHGVKIERIVSSGTQPVGRYCQPADEWILLLQGHAEMRIGGELVALRDGDYLHIPARTPHELVSTSPNALWLAVHVDG